MNLCPDAPEDLSGDDTWEAELRQTVPAREILGRIDALAEYRWTGDLRQALLVAFDGLEGEVPVAELEERLENLPELVEGITASKWGQACEFICPEIYKEPRASKKSSAAISGSFSKIWRLSERARHGLSLSHPRDSHGVAEPQQLELFAH